MPEIREKIELTFGGKPFKVSVVAISSKALGRRVYLSGKDTMANHLAMDAESAYRLAVMLFGLSENHAEPIADDELAKDQFMNGDLVRVVGVNGGYRGGTCQIWDISREKPHGHRWVAYSPGTGVKSHHEDEITLVEACAGRWGNYQAPKE